MKNFIEKIKDFLYDAIDYVLILVIVVGVVVVIGWRLDILFAKDMDMPSEENKVVITNNDSNKKYENKDKDIEKDLADNNSNELDKDKNNVDDKSQNSQDTNKEPNNSNETKENTQTDTEQIIVVKIPSGSLPPTIANILLEKGLIENKMDFLIKAQELKLDTRLKSGEFKIKKGIELEELIKLLAK